MNAPADSFESDAQRDAVLQSALAGDETSRDQIIESCRTYLLAIAQGRLDETLRAKIGSSDVVQETCIRAHAAFNQFRGQTYSELLAWLRQSLVHNLVDVRRKYRTAQQRDVAREASPREEFPQSGPGAPVDPLLTPSSAADLDEQIAGLRSALQQLSEEYRRVIVWRNWEQKSFAEIGAALNRSEEAARKLWTRAVAKLADFLPPDQQI